MSPKRLLHLLLPLTVFLVAFSHGLTPVRSSNDVWWHLKTGQYIVENGYKLPKIDPFNAIAHERGIEWHNHEWMGQIMMWWAYRAGEVLFKTDFTDSLGRRAAYDGLHSLIFAKAFLLGLAYVGLGMLAARISGARLPGYSAALLAIMVGRFTIHPRPPIYTYLFLVLLYALLHAARTGHLSKRWLAITLPFFGFWANIHGGWAAGGVVLACFAAGSFFDALGYHYRRTPIADLPRALWNATWPWVGAGVLGLIGTLGNPSTTHLYSIFGRVLKDKQLVGAIGELAPPETAFVGPFWLAIIALIILAATSGKRFPWFAEYLFVPFFLWQAIHHQRHLTLFGILMAPFLAWLLAESLRGLPKGIAGVGRVIVMLIFIFGAWHAVFNFQNGRTYWQRNRQFLSGVSWIRSGWPVAEVEHLRQQSILHGDPDAEPKRLFNTDTYAGYVIWRLAPEHYRVVSDSRFDIFGGDLQRHANSIAMALPGWEAEFDGLDVDAALILHRDEYRLRYVLDDQAGWKKIPAPPKAGWTLFVREAAE